MPSIDVVSAGRSRSPGTTAARVARWSAVGLLAIVAAPSVGRGGPPSLASEVRGSGAPTIVLIHGPGQDWNVWNRTAARLESTHRVVRVDLPGHGRSASIRTAGLDETLGAFDRTLRQRKIKNALLVGHSYGGLLALAEAADHEDRVAGIVVVDIPSVTKGDSAAVATLENLLQNRYSLFLQAVIGAMTVQDTLADSLISWAERVPRDVLSSYFREMWNLDLRPRVARVRAPILLVANDQTWPPGESWTSARTRLGFESAGGAIGRRMENSGHLIPFDQPDRLASEILEFAATINPSRR